MLRRETVRAVYDQWNPTAEQKARMRDNLLQAASQQSPRRKDTVMKFPKKKVAMIAIAAAMAMMLGGCAAYAVSLLNLNQLSVAKETYHENARYQEDGTKVEATEKTKTILSLQGITDSNSQKAAQEWYEFEKSYDPDDKLLFQNDDFVAPEDYQAYFVYTPEMIAKVDEICQKYDLKLAGPLTLIQNYQSDVFYDALGIPSLLKSGAQGTVDQLSGYFYACGNFNAEFALTLSGSSRKHPLSASYRRNDKQYFDTVFLHMPEDAVQQDLTLSDGTELLAVKSDTAVDLFCDQKDAFLFVQLSSYYPEEPITDQDIQLAVEALDFSVSPKKPDLAAVKVQLEASEKEYQAQQEARLQEAANNPMDDPFAKGSYQELVRGCKDDPEAFLYYTGGCRWEDIDSFALLDSNGDGEEELVFGNDGKLVMLVCMKDGKTYPFWGSAELFLAEGGIFGQRVWHNDGSLMYYFSRIEGDMDLDYYVGYSSFTGVWKYSTGWNEEQKEISEEKAKEIIDSYPPIKIDWKPISEFPLN